MKRFLGAVSLCALFAFAQVNTARIDGTVTDPTGAAVPAAEVTVSNPATNLSIKATTNEKGEVSVPSLQAATYRVSVMKSGFRVSNSDGIVVNAGVPATVNITLEI